MTRPRKLNGNRKQLSNARKVNPNGGGVACSLALAHAYLPLVILLKKGRGRVLEPLFNLLSDGKEAQVRANSIGKGF